MLAESYDYGYLLSSRKVNITQGLFCGTKRIRTYALYQTRVYANCPFVENYLRKATKIHSLDRLASSPGHSPRWGRGLETLDYAKSRYITACAQAVGECPFDME